MPFASLVASSPLLQPWCLLASRLTSSRCHPGITQQGMVSSKRWSLVSHPPASKPPNHETPLEGMHSEPNRGGKPLCSTHLQQGAHLPPPLSPPPKKSHLLSTICCAILPLQKCGVTQDHTALMLHRTLFRAYTPDARKGGPVLKPAAEHPTTSQRKSKMGN